MSFTVSSGRKTFSRTVSTKTPRKVISDHLLTIRDPLTLSISTDALTFLCRMPRVDRNNRLSRLPKN
ncbi:hypothetical protein XELAEV_18011486mg [Xenopus laevis]|uniref:Uncharacterized protein n=1 Tax=Xenopus laevis TaxID=8355 RepID=A0A974HXI0_XENLA|nr:hypothetical protein XELAEV_18011486mg [Xenopus laevis]